MSNKRRSAIPGTATPSPRKRKQEGETLERIVEELKGERERKRKGKEKKKICESTSSSSNEDGSGNLPEVDVGEVEDLGDLEGTVGDSKGEKGLWETWEAKKRCKKYSQEWRIP